MNITMFYQFVINVLNYCQTHVFRINVRIIGANCVLSNIFC
jgi:hypothetical protein